MMKRLLLAAALLLLLPSLSDAQVPPGGCGFSSTVPCYVTGSITASNPSVGTTGAAVPASATYIGINNGGNLVAPVAGHGTAAGAMRVELPTDGTGVVGIAAGSAIIGNVRIDQTTPGTTNGVQVNAALPAGTNLIGNVGSATGSAVPAAGVYLGASSGGNLTGLLIGAGTEAGALRVTLPTDGTGSVTLAPSAAAGVGITPSQIAAAGSSLVLKASAGNLYTASVSVGATALYLMVFNATSAPVDGAVTPALCYGPLPINAPFSLSWSPGPPAVFATGITLVSSSTGCFTKTASNAAFLSGQAK